MSGLFLARLPLLAALCAAVAVLAWAAFANRDSDHDRPPDRDRRERRRKG